VNRPGGDDRTGRGELAVKKLLLLAVAGAAAFMMWRKVEADKAEQALWAEVTDPVR
jgi:hypothetical protein